MNGVTTNGDILTISDDTSYKEFLDRGAASIEVVLGLE
jgi:hypothetical protein